MPRPYQNMSDIMLGERPGFAQGGPDGSGSRVLPTYGANEWGAHHTTRSSKQALAEWNKSKGLDINTSHEIKGDQELQQYISRYMNAQKKHYMESDKHEVPITMRDYYRNQNNPVFTEDRSGLYGIKLPLYSWQSYNTGGRVNRPDYNPHKRGLVDEPGGYYGQGPMGGHHAGMDGTSDNNGSGRDPSNNNTTTTTTTTTTPTFGPNEEGTFNPHEGLQDAVTGITSEDAGSGVQQATINTLRNQMIEDGLLDYNTTNTQWGMYDPDPTDDHMTAMQKAALAQALTSVTNQGTVVEGLTWGGPSSFRDHQRNQEIINQNPDYYSWGDEQYGLNLSPEALAASLAEAGIQNIEDAEASTLDTLSALSVHAPTDEFGDIVGPNPHIEGQINASMQEAMSAQIGALNNMAQEFNAQVISPQDATDKDMQKAYGTLAKALGITTQDAMDKYSPEAALTAQGVIEGNTMNFSETVDAVFGFMRDKVDMFNPLNKSDLGEMMASLSASGLAYGTYDMGKKAMDMGMDSEDVIGAMFGQLASLGMLGKLGSMITGLDAGVKAESFGNHITGNTLEADMRTNPALMAAMAAASGYTALRGDDVTSMAIDAAAAAEWGYGYMGPTGYMSSDQFNNVSEYGDLYGPTSMAQYSAYAYGALGLDGQSESPGDDPGGRDDFVQQTAEHELNEGTGNLSGNNYIADQSNWTGTMKAEYDRLKRRGYDDQYIDLHFAQLGLV